MNIIKEYSILKNIGYNNKKLYVKNSGDKGLGVFTGEDIKFGDVVEYCHCIVLDQREKHHSDKELFRYAYPGDDEISDEWVEHGRKFLIPLGYGSIYNSSEFEKDANAKFKTYTLDKLIIFYALRDIVKDSEILVWWSQDYYDFFCSAQNKK